jgi:hypothetical protein
MKIIIVVSFGIMILIVACWGTKGKRIKDKQDLSVTKEVTLENLVGGWVIPISQEPGMQGVQFNRDGSATTINMHTLVYDKWKLKNDTIFLWSVSTGVKEMGIYIDTLVVQRLTDSVLNVIDATGMRMKYTRVR